MVHWPSSGLQMWEGSWGLGLRSLYYGRDQIIDGVLAQLILQWAHADLSGVITLVPDWITEIEILGKKQILYIIPFPWIKDFLLRRTKKKPLQLTSFHTSKIVQKISTINFGELQRIGSLSKTWEMQSWKFLPNPWYTYLCVWCKTQMGNKEWQ